MIPDQPQPDELDPEQALAALNGLAAQPPPAGEDDQPRDEVGRFVPHQPGRHRQGGPIPSWEIQRLCRDLAAGDVTRAALARRYGVTRSAITQFAQRNASRIAEIKADLDQEFAGLWIADKASRIAVYQNEVERIANYDHHEWVKAKAQILKNVAEETGQLPPRAQAVIVPVIHVIEAGGEINIEEDLT